MKILAILIALLFPHAAAADVFVVDGREWMTLEIPQKWRDAPLTKRYSVVEYPADRVREICTRAVGYEERFACVFVYEATESGMPERCSIYIAAGLPPAMYDDALEHELAHCKGWPADHPQPRQDPQVRADIEERYNAFLDDRLDALGEKAPPEARAQALRDANAYKRQLEQQH